MASGQVPPLGVGAEAGPSKPGTPSQVLYILSRVELRLTGDVASGISTETLNYPPSIQSNMAGDHKSDVSESRSDCDPGEYDRRESGGSGWLVRIRFALKF